MDGVAPVHAGTVAPLGLSPAARLPTLDLRPVRQGELDGLCGLYAAINALRLAVAPARRLTRAEARVLFHEEVEALNAERELHEVVAHGLGSQLWLDALARLAMAASALIGRPIAVSRPLAGAILPSRARMLEVIEAAIRAGQPVLVSLSGAHDHYTVIRGYSAHRLLLFDSSNLHWLPRYDCGPRRVDERWRHRIKTQLITTLSLA